MLAEALQGMGYRVVDRTVLRLLKASQGGTPAVQPQDSRGASDPDRDGQFADTNATVKAAIAAGEPVISAKNRELVGDFRFQGGRAGA